MENKSLKELKGNAKNPRTINKEDYKNLVQSIKRFGDLSGIVFNVRTQQLAGGHQRQKAFAEIGADDIVITQRLPEKNSVGTTAVGYVMLNGERFGYREVDWDSDFEKAANVAANRIQGEFDLDLLAEITYEISQAENASDLLNLTGQTEDEINRLLDMSGASGESDPAEDEAPEVDNANPPVSKLGEIYQLGVHRLMCGDSTDFGAVSDLLDGTEPELLLTDPPYNMDYQGGGIFENHINQSFKDNIKPLVDFEPAKMFEVIETIKPKTNICFASKDLIYEYINFIKDNNKNFNLLTWHKTNPIPMNNGNFLPDTEYIFYWYDKGTRKFNNNVEGVDYHKYYIGEINEGRREGENQHPTIKPQSLLIKFIKICSDRGDVVLDLFSGSGSGLIASETTGRIFYGMELDPKYCDVIRKRYHKHTTGQEEGWQEATKPINEVSDETTTTAIPTES
jgi:DNA modification methylase